MNPAVSEHDAAPAPCGRPNGGKSRLDSRVRRSTSNFKEIQKSLTERESGPNKRRHDATLRLNGIEQPY